MEVTYQPVQRPLELSGTSWQALLGCEKVFRTLPNLARLSLTEWRLRLKVFPAQLDVRRVNQKLVDHPYDI
jgi:hypothetical protein